MSDNLLYGERKAKRAAVRGANREQAEGQALPSSDPALPSCPLLPRHFFREAGAQAEQKWLLQH